VRKGGREGRKEGGREGGGMWIGEGRGYNRNYFQRLGREGEEGGREGGKIISNSTAFGELRSKKDTALTGPRLGEVDTGERRGRKKTKKPTHTTRPTIPTTKNTTHTHLLSPPWCPWEFLELEGVKRRVFRRSERCPLQGWCVGKVEWKLKGRRMGQSQMHKGGGREGRERGRKEGGGSIIRKEDEEEEEEGDEPSEGRVEEEEEEEEGGGEASVAPHVNTCNKDDGDGDGTLVVAL
jgi:hypothetical protein